MKAFHAQSAELGGRLSGLLERYQQYQDEVISIHSWLSAHEQNQSATKSSGDTDPQNLQSALRQVQVGNARRFVEIKQTISGVLRGDGCFISAAAAGRAG